MFLGISVDAWSSIFIGVLILAGTITQGTIGFGLGTIATPIIALIRPELVPTLILLLALCISSYTLARTYRETSWRVVGVSSLARIPGSLVGAWAIASLSPDGLSIFIGCAVLFAMTLSSLGWSPRPTTVNTLIAGVASGILGTIATPIIALIRPELVPTLILLLALCISSYTLARTYRETSWRVVGVSSLARIPGSLVGAWAIASLSPDGLSIFIGCAVLLAMTLSSLGWSPRPTTANTLIAGVASGILGTSTSIGGPPMALIMKRFDPNRTRGTLAGTFVLGTLISLIILAFNGQISGTQVTTAAAYFPLVVIGLIAANYLNRFIDRHLLNRIVITVAIAAALMLIVESALF